MIHPITILRDAAGQVNRIEDQHTLVNAARYLKSRLSTEARARRENRKIKMVCLECGKPKMVNADTRVEPRCSCGSVDLDVT